MSGITQGWSADRSKGFRFQSSECKKIAAYNYIVQMMGVCCLLTGMRSMVKVAVRLEK